MKTVKELKKGEYFTRKNIEYPSEKQVFIRGDYDRESKRYICLRFDDCNYSVSLKGSSEVFTDFIF